MNSDSDDLLGWELTFHSVENTVSKKEDLLIVFLHWTLIKSGFLCVGIGDVKSEEEEKGSELLPRGWNEDDSYSLRYISKTKNKPYLLKGSIVKEFLVLEFVRIEDMTIAALTVSARTVSGTDFNKPLPKVIPEYKTILNKFKTELVAKLHKAENIKEMETQTPREPSPSHWRSPPSPPISRTIPPPERRPDRERDRDRYADPFGVGRSDLDPLGGVGGMIFDPFSRHRENRRPDFGVPGGLPRGAVPPGARFDPFGPPGNYPFPPAPRRPPDADHLPPPGYDDMFM